MGGGDPSMKQQFTNGFVYYAKDNVQVHLSVPKPGITSKGIQGRISVIHYSDAPYLQWAPYSLLRSSGVDWERFVIRCNTGKSAEPSVATPTSTSGDAATPSGVEPATVASPDAITVPSPASSPADDYAIMVPLDGIHSVKQKVPNKVLGGSIPFVTVTVKGGVTLTPFHFHDGGLLKFFSALREHLTLSNPPGDRNTFLVNDQSDLLQRSLRGLNMQGVGTPRGDVVPSIVGQADDVDLDMKEISLQVLDKFSKVTKIAREAGNIIFGQPQPGSSNKAAASRTRSPSPVQQQSEVSRPAEEVEEPIYGNTVALTEPGQGQEAGPPEASPTDKAAEFQIVSGPSYSLDPVNIEPRGYVLDNDGLAELRDASVGSFTKESEQKLRERIFYGGIDHDLRKELWPILLDYYPAGSTFEERRAIKQEKTKEYHVLKNQWKSIGERQAQRFSAFTLRVHRIEKDVTRTDRAQEYYSGDENPNVSVLKDILVTYSFFNFDIGYCQGMSDLLGPILYVMNDEVDAFWCFVGIMDRVEANYNEDQVGMATQLSILRNVVKVTLPDLYAYLESNDCLNLFFCFRWILIMFKREFPFADIMRLWEMMWSHHRPNFYIFLAAAILQRFERYIIDTQMQFDDILQFVNELAMNLSLNDIMQDADRIFEKVITDHSFNEDIAPILSRTFI